MSCQAKYELNLFWFSSYFLVCDSDQSCFVLSVYGIRNDTCYKFKSIRVDFLEQVLVNGKALPPHQAISTSIYAQHKP
ncbi:hypothetical protein Gohar_020693 [Gossypium harknessii]|uniref:Uncharacterized protein n=1 Tax=Gossypium harknessii TaxID=34285 RepID=A0A7J9HZW6_9ROSI|nr:hypothetical protein [Gossypium harknessii]